MQELIFPQNIHVERDRLIIESFTTGDLDVVTYFKDKKMEDYAHLLETALKAGTVALQSVTVVEKIDYVQKEFSALDNKFSTNLKERIQELDRRFEDYFGEKGKISELINAHFGENGKIVKEIFDPNRDGTPLFMMSQDFKRQLSDLREKLGIKEEVDQLKARTTLKGYDFEGICEQKLSEIARMNSDELEKTTDKVGTLPRSKKGDYVVTLPGKNKRRIVFELKNLSEKISVSKIHEWLEESMKNRDASYGVFVIRNVEALPESVGWFNEYSANQLVCALSRQDSEDITNLENLMIAYRWAKMRMLLETAVNQRLDVGKLKEFVADLQGQLQRFATIRTQCGSIERSARDIKSVSDELKDHIDEGITEVLKTITADNS